MKKDKFEIRERVKVITKFYTWQNRFQLPDECLFFGELDNKYIILWHGTTHTVNKRDVYKLKDSNKS